MLKVKNWKTFQHYKDRNPPWIKLATDVFQNYDFSKLNDASKLLAICIWTLASRSIEGEVPADLEYIKQKSFLGDLIQECHLKELILKGFIIDASNMLATCKQSARPETEGYREERETESERFLDSVSVDKKNTEIEEKKAKATRLQSFLDKNSELKISEEWGEWAITIGLNEIEINEQMHIFCDYWAAAAGQKGVKLDWTATWRNWCRKALKERKQKEQRDGIFKEKFSRYQK